MRLASLFVAFLVTATSFSAAAAEPIKELNISYVKPPFVLQLLVMKNHKLLEKEFQADGIKINWHNMGTSPQAARAMLKISKANKASVRKVLSYISSSLPPWRKKA